MKDPNAKPGRDELIALLPTPGWKFVAGSKTLSEEDRTLEEIARVAHERHARGEPAGLIARMENVLELDLVQLQQLWEYMGLPI